jgi:hypothetical protein
MEIGPQPLVSPGRHSRLDDLEASPVVRSAIAVDRNGHRRSVPIGESSSLINAGPDAVIIWSREDDRRTIRDELTLQL